MKNRVKLFDGVVNFRDFGGYDTQNGDRVVTGKLFRSGHFHNVTAADKQQLDQMDLDLLLDMRRPDERERQPNNWPAGNARTYTNDLEHDSQEPAHVAFLEQSKITKESVHGHMVTYYINAPYERRHIDYYRHWFQQLKTGINAVIHCAAGKDRTGIGAALTLTLLGVDEETVFEDYLLTNTAVDLEKRLPEAAKTFGAYVGKELTPELIYPFMGVDAAYLTAAFQTIREKDGSIGHYAQRRLGVSPEDIEALKQNFLTQG